MDQGTPLRTSTDDDMQLLYVQLENDPSRNLVTKAIFCGVFQDSVVYEEDDRVELYRTLS